MLSWCDRSKVFNVEYVIPYLNCRGTICFNYHINGYFDNSDYKIFPKYERCFSRILAHRPTGWEKEVEESNKICEKELLPERFHNLKDEGYCEGSPYGHGEPQHNTCYTYANWFVTSTVKKILDRIQRYDHTCFTYDFHYLAQNKDDLERRYRNRTEGESIRQYAAVMLSRARETLRIAEYFLTLYELQRDILVKHQRSFTDYDKVLKLQTELKKDIKIFLKLIPKKRQRKIEIPPIKITKKTSAIESSPTRYGYIYLIRPTLLGKCGTIGYVGQTVSWENRIDSHLSGKDPCTHELIREIKKYGDNATFELFGPFPKQELDSREHSYAHGLVEAGWRLRNRKKLA